MASLSRLTSPMLLSNAVLIAKAAPTASSSSPLKANATNSHANIVTPSPSPSPSPAHMAHRCHPSSSIMNMRSVAASATAVAWQLGSLALVVVSILASMVASMAVHIATGTAAVARHAGWVLAAVAAQAAHRIVALAVQAWTCKRAERMRKKIYFEIALALLGPGGTLLLVVLWPGWLLLAAAAEALWVFARGA